MTAVPKINGYYHLDLVNPKVQITFQKELSTEALWETIGKYEKPKVIFWYIGANGFREKGVEYYKKHLKAIRQLNNNSSCLLYGISAWAALRYRDTHIESENPNVSRINQFGIKGISALSSAKFFAWLKNTSDPVSHYLKNTVLSRKFIFRLSENVTNTDLTISEVFNNNCPALEPLYQMDCAKAYSALQYLEGLYLIAEIAKKAQAANDGTVDIILALPNNEWEYYEDENGSFEKDVQKLLELNGIKDLHVHIAFCCFKFGKKNSHRPYNALGGNMNLLKRSDLIDELEGPQVQPDAKD